MKKALIFAVILVFLPVSAYPFWIWSPKTSKWKNPQNSPLATPYLQYKQAIRVFEEAKYKEAYQEFRKFLVYYPDAKEAAEAQFYLAICLEKMDKSYEAFLQYQKLIDSYPNSQRINEVVEKQYNIGEFFLDRDAKKYLGVSFYDFVEHPSVEIFQTIVLKVPYSEYAPRAQYKLGMIFVKLGRYDEARDAFQKVIDDYSDSEWSMPAKYQMALATARAYPGVDYDSSYVKDAARRLDEFIKEHPQAQISSSAEDQLGELRNREAKKNYDIAVFYELQDQYRSAAIYYRKVIVQYPDSEYYDRAVEKIKEMDVLVESDLTKSQMQNIQRRAQAEEKRAANLRIKERKSEQKLERIQEARVKKQAILQAKLDKAQEIIQQKKALETARLAAEQDRISKKLAQEAAAREVKLKRVQEAKAKKQEIIKKKQELRTAKLAAKQSNIDKYLAEKAVAREAKLRQAKEIRAKKQAIHQAKLDKKREAVERKQELEARKLQAKQMQIKLKLALKEKKYQENLKRIQEAKAKRQALRLTKEKKKDALPNK